MESYGDLRKRPRRLLEEENPPPQSGTLPVPTMTITSTKLLETELDALRAELHHSQAVRAIERKNASRSEARLKRQLADAYDELSHNQELIDSLREESELHEQKMEAWRGDWLERIRWYEERMREAKAVQETDELENQSERSSEECQMLKTRLDAALHQIEELNRLLKEAEERATRMEQKVFEAEFKTSQLTYDTHRSEVVETNSEESNDESSNSQTLRAQRIKIAEVERDNRELLRRNEDLNGRLREMIHLKERAATYQRRMQQLEKEVQELTRHTEEGKELQQRWIEFRNEIMMDDNCFRIGVDDTDSVSANDDDILGVSAIPPEVATVLRKFQALRHIVRNVKEENARLSQLRDTNARRCTLLEAQVEEKTQIISSLEKNVKSSKETISELELENRKIIAQQDIWKRETEGMRSLLDTYSTLETLPQTKPLTSSERIRMTGKNERSENLSYAAQSLQMSSKYARDEVKSLTESNQKLSKDLELLQAQHETASIEHKRVLEKFTKLRAALTEEQSKVQAAESRAVKAETLSGKGHYNSETSRVVHLESNPLADAVKEKYQKEIAALKQRLAEAENMVQSSTSMVGTATPAPYKSEVIFGSASATATSSSSGLKEESFSSLDAQKLHKRLKERFKEQIGLFREGVYLITGFKIDMSFSDTDSPRFKVRSIYAEREEDHLMFQWKRKVKEVQNDEDDSHVLDLMSTELAKLLMMGPSAVYMTQFNSVPAFMASVNLALFEKQTMA